MLARPATPLSPVWVIIPAAGLGSRMGGATPKQYLLLNNVPLLQMTLAKMLALPNLAGVVVALNGGDSHWSSLAVNNRDKTRLHTVEGGAERADSVLAGLSYLREQGVPDDHWVLVHDAARPCVLPGRISRLREKVEAAGVVGGILAKPVADTLKRVTDGETITGTCDRSALWQAHTPQMFRLGVLAHALASARELGVNVTDEASAVEEQGGQPIVVEDRRDNIKVTHPEDLALAEMILLQQQSEEDAL